MTQSTTTKPAETKSALVKRLLTRKAGADVAALQKATGWQPHSVRAVLSMLRKGGYTIEKTSPKSERGGPVYRITATPERA